MGRSKIVTEAYIKDNYEVVYEGSRKDSPSVGDRYNYLTLYCFGRTGKRGSVSFWKCDCGNIIETKPVRVKTGHTKTCGCRLHNDKIDYYKFLKEYSHRLQLAGILYVSQDQWKSDKIPYYCNVHKEAKFTCKAVLRKFSVAPCFKCGKKVASSKRVKTTEQFIEDSKTKWGDIFDYSKTVYTGSHDRLTLICPEGTEFTQTATDHLSGFVGCPCCNGGGGGYSVNKSGSFYLFKWSDGETEFLKYGITNKCVYDRANKQKHRRSFVKFEPEYITSVEFDNGKDCLDFETKVKRDVGKHFISKEVFPDGFSETLPIDKLDQVLEMISSL